ncbi:Fanconi anemia group J protein homolog isoform X2 [Trichogramma pretiosum]|uniref:Fanconi anemia group J protein homolog isoform X2 n=1 Tax=Trichogramma pretiosum TaxID=7493 RepID=UPI0006C9C1A3|nr:Fanconi anemia group J protein homolog isoform X2 [Trichogramma pretiosum]
MADNNIIDLTMSDDEFCDPKAAEKRWQSAQASTSVNQGSSLFSWSSTKRKPPSGLENVNSPLKRQKTTKATHHVIDKADNIAIITDDEDEDDKRSIPLIKKIDTEVKTPIKEEKTPAKGTPIKEEKTPFKTTPAKVSPGNYVSPPKSTLQEKVLKQLYNIMGNKKSRYEDIKLPPGLPPMIAGVPVKFPVTPYRSQIAVMNAVIKGCTKSEHCLLESPTGSGKTLALLCAALAFQTHLEENPQGDDKKTSKSGVPSPNGADTCCSKPGKKGKCEDYDDEGWDPLKEINSAPRVPKIYYGSRTHKQIEQVIREFKKTCYHDKRMTILSSREHTCIHHKVEGLSKTALCNELRDPLKNKKGCPFYNEGNKGALSSHDRLAAVGLETPWDIEDIVAVGKQANACPYFGARNLMGDASIIFCPYNYLIDPSIRESMGIDLTNEIVIVDEAHNIESICRDAGSAEFREDALLEAAEDCHLLFNLTKNSYYDVINKYLLKLHEVINDVYVPESSTKYGETHSDFWKGNELWTKLTANGLGEDNYSAFKVACRTAINEYNQAKEDIANEVDREDDDDDGRSKKNEKRRKKLKDPTTISHITKNLLVLMEMALMCVKDAEFTQDYRCVISKAYHQDVKTKPAKSGEWVETRGEVKKPQFLRTLKFLCMNPAIIFRGMARNTRSVILASGTLSPTTTFEGELGLTFAHQLHANHVITKDQVYVRPIGRGPNGVSLRAVYANVGTFDFKDELGSLLVQVCETVPHGVLCFFSSYAMMTGQLERWQETGVWGRLEAHKCIVQEPRYSGDLDAMMREYRDAIRDTAAGRSQATGRDGALMFAVFRGKVAEGIDFSDNEARCVITVGIPYAVRTEPSVKMKMEYNDQPMNKARKLLSGSEWYNVQAYRALNQALGRCIRHRNDWGAILLVDERFLWANTMTYLPKWVREMKRDNNQFNLKDDLKKFVNERKAHDDKTKRLSN